MDKSNILIILLSIFSSVILTYLVILAFRKFHLSQPILELAPENHMKKQGIATMGGIAVILTTTCISLFVVGVRSKFSLPILSMLLFGLIGIIDDLTKIISNKNLGLTPKAKMILQVLFSLIIAFLINYHGLNYVKIPLVTTPISLSIFTYPLIVIYLVGVTNSTNLTDGLDGLLSTLSITCSIFVIHIAKEYNLFQLHSMMLVFVASLVGFLVFNRYPAKIFLGDTGSLAIGGFLATSFLVINAPLFLLLAGIIFVLETLSVIIQVTYFKKTGKRIFLMSPLHHHYEKKGFSEYKVVGLFALVNLIGVFMALVLYK